MRHLARGLLLACVATVAAVAAASTARAAERVALVIGNSAYRHAPELKNPANDARAMTQALERVGFEVIGGYDLDRDAMRSTVTRFEKALDGARVSLVFYSGHGIGVDGVNYLLPIDAELDTRSALQLEAVSADWLLNDVVASPDRISIIMLDACRNNPFSRSFGPKARAVVSPGLAEVQARNGAYVAFATAPGATASDGRGDNSPFTSAVLRHIATPGLEIDGLMKTVRREVWEETGEQQLPWTNSALLGNFYFVPPGAEGAGGGGAQVAALAPDTDTTATAPKPSADDIRLAQLKRMETALLPTASARTAVQADLAALGYLAARPDGTFGADTREAVRGFQAVAKLDPTGYVDKVTRQALKRQVARLEPPAEEQPRPARRPRVAPPQAPAQLTPAEQDEQAQAQARVEEAAAPPPVARSGLTMGECTMPKGGWAGVRVLSFDQCRKLGGSFAPQD